MTEPTPTPADDTNKVDTAKAVDPKVTSANESTPIFDETVQAVETADSVKADVKRALERKTDDGKGDEDPGPSDFQGFATEGVEETSQ